MRGAGNARDILMRYERPAELKIPKERDDILIPK